MATKVNSNSIKYYYYGEDEQNMAIAATQINSNTIIAKIYYIKEDGRRITNMHSQTSIIITNKKLTSIEEQLCAFTLYGDESELNWLECVQCESQYFTQITQQQFELIISE